MILNKISAPRDQKSRANVVDSKSVYKYSFIFYTGLKLGSKTHFYGRLAPEGILAITTYENGTFYGRRAAEANFSVLVHFYGPFSHSFPYKNETVLVFESSIDLPQLRDFFIKLILSDGAHSAPSDFFHPCDETLRHVATFARIPRPRGMSCHDVTFALMPSWPPGTYDICARISRHLRVGQVCAPTLLSDARYDAFKF